MEKEEVEWTTKEDVISTHNTWAFYVIFSGVDSSQFQLVPTKEAANKQAWNILETVHEGSSCKECKGIKHVHLRCVNTEHQNRPLTATSSEEDSQSRQLDYLPFNHC